MPKLIPGIIVHNCNDCPYYRDAEQDSSQAWCSHPEHYQAQGYVRDFTEDELDHEDDIPVPGWCPLQDGEAP